MTAGRLADTRPTERRLADVDDMVWFAERFEEHRPRLLSVAYRMLGSRTEAEDALQEAWLRSTRADGSTIDNVDGWLTTVVGRVCIDLLRTRQARRESLTGTWLPEPVVSRGERPDPEEESLLADSVGLALLVILETLDPAERLAFVLHDMFGVPFAEIAPIVERTPEATRQLASRARRRVSGSRPRRTPTCRPSVGSSTRSWPRPAPAIRRAYPGPHPDVVFRVDTGGRASLAPALLIGAVEVAEHAATHGPRFASLAARRCQRRRRHRGPRPPWRRGRRGRDHRDRRTDRRDRPDPRPGQDRLGRRLRPIPWTPPGPPPKRRVWRTGRVPSRPGGFQQPGLREAMLVAGLYPTYSASRLVAADTGRPALRARPSSLSSTTSISTTSMS